MKVITSSWAPFICAVVAVAPSTAAGAIGSWHTLSASAGATDKPASAATNPNVFKIIDFLLPWSLRPLANRGDTSISNGAEGRPSRRSLLRKTAIGGKRIIFHLTLHAPGKWNVEKLTR